MQQNYNKLSDQKELDKLIRRHSQAGETPSLLLHSCCGPCSGYVLEYLSAYFNITLFYYNPNILPKEEYTKRVHTQKQFVNIFSGSNSIEFLEGAYEPKKFLLAVKGFEDEPEGGKRCEICFRLRLEESAKTAKKLGCDYFSTTLSVSPHKNADILAEISQNISEAYGINALPANFKKKGGYQRSIQLSHMYGLYRQEYCGCPFARSME